MRNLLALIGALVVVGGGVGWYMGWYKLSITREADGTLQITTNWDTNKATKDVTDGVKNISTAVENKANEANTPPPAGTPGATPGPATPAQSSQFNPFASPIPDAPKVPNGVTITPPNGKIQLIAPK